LKILVVCSGNICRSPMAAAVLRDRLERAGRTDVSVSSAGTLGIVGEPADPVAVSVAAEAGYDIGGHRSSALTAGESSGADLVLVMEEHHARKVGELAPARASTFLLGSFLPASPARSDSGEIADPMGEGPEAFRECLKTIEDSIDRFLKHWLDGNLSAEAGPEAELRYFSEIGDRILAARGGGAGLTSLEFHVVDGWWKRDLPLWLVLEALSESSLDWPPGEVPRGFIRHLSREVEARAAEAGLAGERPAARGSAPGDPEGIRRDLIKDLRAAERRVGKAHPRLRAELKAAGRALKAAPGSLLGIEAEIRKSRAAIVQSARESLPLGALERMEAEERARLAALSRRLSPGAAEETLQRLVEERLLGYFDLPAMIMLHIGSG